MEIWSCLSLLVVSTAAAPGPTFRKHHKQSKGEEHCAHRSFQWLSSYIWIRHQLLVSSGYIPFSRQDLHVRKDHATELLALLVRVNSRWVLRDQRWLNPWSSAHHQTKLFRISSPLPSTRLAVETWIFQVHDSSSYQFVIWRNKLTSAKRCKEDNRPQEHFNTPLWTMVK